MPEAFSRDLLNMRSCKTPCCLRSRERRERRRRCGFEQMRKFSRKFAVPFAPFFFDDAFTDQPGVAWLGPRYGAK